MTKAELDAETQAYELHVAASKQQIRDGRWLEAIESCKAAWPHIVGMMQFKKRYEKAPPIVSLAAFDAVFQLAPTTFAIQAIDDLERLIQAQKKIDRGTVVDEVSQVQQTRHQLETCRLVWHMLSTRKAVTTSEAVAGTGRPAPEVRRALETWKKMDLVQTGVRNGSTTYDLSVDPMAQVPYKCNSCGTFNRVAYLHYLEETACRRCGSAETCLA